MQYPTQDDYNRAKNGDPKAIALINKAQSEVRTASLSQSELSTIALEHGVMKLFIARLISQHKTNLVQYVNRCQMNIDQAKWRIEHVSGHQHREDDDASLIYWRAELNEATRELELSDRELMPLIRVGKPEHLVTRMENAMLDAAPDGPNGPVVKSASDAS